VGWVEVGREWRFVRMWVRRGVGRDGYGKG
jgi:hypothetical protein